MRDTPEAALIWQYRGKPRARQTVGLLFSESRELWTSVLTLASLLDIDKATGYGLDLIGRHVELGRTLNAFIPKAYFGWLGADAAQGFGDGVFYLLGEALNDSTRLEDDDYRFLLRARVLKNTLRPTMAAISAAIRYLLGPQVVVIDNHDMSMNKGMLQLSSATDSDSETMAATPKAVKAIADTLSGGRLLNIQSFTESGIYTPTPGTQKIRVKCWGLC